MLQREGSVLEKLCASPWSLNISEIAIVLDIDEVTAAMVLRMLRESGHAVLSGDRWAISLKPIAPSEMEAQRAR